MRNKEVRLVVNKFKYHYKAITGNEAFRMNMTETRLTMTKSFISKVKDFNNTTILGEDYLRSYMEFQFNYWFEHDAKYGKGTSIQLEWIIGNKAWKRWIGRSEKYKKATSHFVRKNLKRKIKFKIDGVRNKGWGDSMKRVNDIEEFEKSMFYNSAKGFINCTLNTTMYNHKSIKCVTCKYKEKCQVQLKEQLPSVYSLRGYGGKR